MGRPSKWSPEFREEAVRLYRESGESVAEVARRLGDAAEVGASRRGRARRARRLDDRRARRDPRTPSPGPSPGGGEVDPAEGGGVFRAGDRSAAMTFQLIDQERPHHAVSLLCSVLDVSRQGYWAWKRRPVSRRRIEDERLKPLIRQAWRDSDETYGAPRLHAELRLAGGVRVGKKRVARLMRELEIEGVSRRRGLVRTTT